MFQAIAKKLFGSANERLIKSLQIIVNEINTLEPEIEKLSDTELRAQTEKLRAQISGGKTLDEVLPEAFATVREASRRTLGMRHFDVQLIGGIILHHGTIAEMKTGEGKTLVATLAAYLNALEGKGVHVVTVNDYLAKRDSEWMGKLYEFLGLSIGCIVHGIRDLERANQYKADITYGTNNEFGFDYLRDNMKFSRNEMVQREFNFAIVDEVDSILIDEARTPLIISGPVEDSTELYIKINNIIPKLREEDYEVDERANSIALTEDGNVHVEELLVETGLMDGGSNLYNISNISLVHHVNQALRAHKLFVKNDDYIVKNDRIIIIDEFTGRMMEGRRYSEGLHQSIEAKEGVPVQNENQTLASITFQNYFRMYPKLAGMTGTAMTEASEFRDIYNLDVIEIPTHVQVARIDEDDEIYRTMQEKNEAILQQIQDCYKRQQPVLVGTVSIEKSEYLAKLLKKNKIKHNVLNARYHEKEAHIIAQAGRPGAVTIATNMAGRGTDIMLGGNPEMMVQDQLGSDSGPKRAEQIKEQVKLDKQKVIEAGGLFVLGTERHESRRIDNQLRGRSGRQGDSGHSKFFISLEDDLMRIFGPEKMNAVMRMGLEEGEAIQHPWMSKALEKAQKKVEAQHYEVRKNLLKFDDVMNDQRKVIYDQRIEIMESDDVSDIFQDIKNETIEHLVSMYMPEKLYAEQWETDTLEKEVLRIFGLNIPIVEMSKQEGVANQEILEKIKIEVDDLFSKKEDKYTPEIMIMAEKRVLLVTLDQMWKDHLLSLDHLRQGISLRAYGQKDPLNEYKREAFSMFENMLHHIRETAIARLAHMEIDVTGGGRIVESISEDMAGVHNNQNMHETRIDPAAGQAMASMAPEIGNNRGLAQISQTVRTRTSSANIDPGDPATWGKTGRNQPCPCGSGKKYKHCHGKL